MAGPALPTNVTAGATGHVAHTNAVHGVVNKFDTTSPTVSGQVPKWNGTVYAPAIATPLGVWADDFYQAGDTDPDGQAIARAIDSVGTGYKVVNLTPGKTYTSTRLITVWSCRVNGNGATVNGGSSGGGLWRITEDGSQLNNLRSSSRAAGGVTVNLAGTTTNVSINNCKLDGSGQTIGINATGIAHVAIANSQISGDTYGLLTNSSATDLRDVRVVNCTFDDIGSDPIELNHPGTAGVNPDNFVVTGCYIRARAASDSSGLPGATSGGFGVGVAHADNVTITGNTFYDCRQQGIHIEDTAAMVTITGNNFVNCYKGLWAIGCSRLTLQGNTFDGGLYGTDITFDATHRVTHILINGNVFRGQTTRGISVESDQTPYAVITGNIVSNTATGVLVNVGGSGYIVSQNITTNISGTAYSYPGTAGTTTGNLAL